MFYVTGHLFSFQSLYIQILDAYLKAKIWTLVGLAYMQS